MKFDEVISMLKLSETMKIQLNNLQNQSVGLSKGKIDRIKTFATEFIEPNDVEKVNIKNKQSRSVCVKDKRIDLHIQNIDGNLQIDRKDFYRGQDDPFIKVGINVSPGKIHLASSTFKTDEKDEKCYTISFDKYNNITSAEIIENGKKMIVNQEEQ